MTCSIQKREPTASRDGGNLSRIEQWKLRLHCRTCETCRTEQSLMRQIETGLQTLASAPTPSYVHAALVAQLPELNFVELPLTHHEDIVLDRDRNVRRRQMRRCWAVAVGGCLVICASNIAVMPNQHNTPLMLFMRYRQEQNRREAIRAFTTDSIRDSDKFNADNLAHAHTMRELWKPWAMQHKTELRQMLRSDKQNQAALRRVLNMLPIFLPENRVGLTHKDLSAHSNQFNWEPLATRNEGIPFHLQRNFTLYHDIILSRSTGVGNVRYSLWASGRITVETYINDSTPQGIASVSAPMVIQVARPYEELISKP